MKRLAYLGIAFAFPLLSLAQTSGGGTLGTDIQDLITFINQYVVGLILAVAFIVFLWGVFQYFIAGGGNEESREKGRTFILYGVIGFVIMFSIWGIVNLLYTSLGLTQNAPPLPTFNSSGSGSTNTQQPFINNISGNNNSVSGQ